MNIARCSPYIKKPKMMPPATAEAIWPETLAPTACISRWFWLFSAMPIFSTIRADMGNAEIPAAPTMGLILVLAEDIENLSEHHAGDGIEDKGHQAQGHNHDGLHGDELVGAHGEGNGDAQQQRDQVGQVVLCRFGQAVEHAALPDQVAEHQEAHQRDRGGSHQAGHEGDHDGEQNAGGLGDTALGRYSILISPLLLGGHQLDGRGLDDGHQGHVGIGGHRDGPNVVGAQAPGRPEWRWGRRRRR